MQTRFALDSETRKKIYISCIYGLIAALSAFGVSYKETANVKTSIVIGVSAFAGTVAASLKEFISGKPSNPEVEKVEEAEE